MKVLVSACLLGEPCRYDGASKPVKAVMELFKQHEIVPFCPEVEGGLFTPRVPAERVGEKVLTKDGKDVTYAYLKGAQKALEVMKKEGITFAILKEKSPSCGKGQIYDGSFSCTLTTGNGVTAELLLQNGIEVLGESEIEKLQG